MTPVWPAPAAPVANSTRLANDACRSRTLTPPTSFAPKRAGSQDLPFRRGATLRWHKPECRQHDCAEDQIDGSENPLGSVVQDKPVEPTRYEVAWVTSLAGALAEQVFERGQRTG